MYKRIVNKLLKHFEEKTIPSENDVVYLTFDDGPEPGITEFVLEELAKYNFKATFFCRGDNAEKYPELLERIREQGHAVANHTYSHIDVYDVSSKDYLDDVERANTILKTSLFRPPHGTLNLVTWMRLRKKYRIFFWSLGSGDAELDKFDYQRSIGILKSNTKRGDIVLFHFCHRHERETTKVLPDYLMWLSENGYRCDVILSR